MAEEAGSPKRTLAAGGMPPVSFREVNGRQKALVASVLDRCGTLKTRFERELQEFKDDETADKEQVVESGVEMMEELGDTVEKLHSMYDLERLITEQERLQKRAPELEEEVRRLKPREDQVCSGGLHGQAAPCCVLSHTCIGCCRAQLLEKWSCVFMSHVCLAVCLWC